MGSFKLTGISTIIRVSEPPHITKYIPLIRIYSIYCRAKPSIVLRFFPHFKHCVKLFRRQCPFIKEFFIEKTLPLVQVGFFLLYSQYSTFHISIFTYKKTFFSFLVPLNPSIVILFSIFSLLSIYFLLRCHNHEYRAKDGEGQSEA